MTESDIYKVMRNWIIDYARILRIENTVSQGTVDAIIFYKGRALMNEFKVIRAGKIKVRPFQISTAVDYTKIAIPDDQYNFVCGCDSVAGLTLYSVEDLRYAPYTILPSKELSIDIKGVKSRVVLRNKQECLNWMTRFNH